MIKVYKKTIGTLNAGETKKVNYKEYIFTDKEVKENFGSDAEVSNPYPIGGFNVYYVDYNHKKHVTYFDSFNIRLI
jgi:hypothetical protein